MRTPPPIDTDAFEAARHGGLRDLIGHARQGHREADLALRQLASKMVGRGEPMPHQLRQFAARALVRDRK
jgi:hypothetical protein